MKCKMSLICRRQGGKPASIWGLGHPSILLSAGCSCARERTKESRQKCRNPKRIRSRPLVPQPHADFCLTLSRAEGFSSHWADNAGEIQEKCDDDVAQTELQSKQDLRTIGAWYGGEVPQDPHKNPQVQVSEHKRRFWNPILISGRRTR